MDVASGAGLPLVGDDEHDGNGNVVGVTVVFGHSCNS